MRSALLIKFLLLFSCVIAYSQPPSSQQINPHTQIRWPINCNQTNYVYNWFLNSCIPASGGGGGGGTSGPQVFIFPAFWNGTVPANTTLNSFIVPIYGTQALVIMIPGNCTGSVFTATAVSTGTQLFLLNKNGTTICTASIAAGTTTATWSGPGGTITSNDRLDLIGGGDSTLSNVVISIAASRTGGVF